MNRDFYVTFFRFSAVALAAALLWLPAAQADSSFSFSFHGGYDGPRHGPFHERYGSYGGYRHEYRTNRHYRVFPGHGIRYGQVRPYWRHGYRHPAIRHYHWHGPRCIYRYGYQYCR